MALGSIIVDLLMRTGSFETDTDRAAKVAKKKAKEIEDSFKGIGNAIAGGIAGFGLAAAIGKVVQESREAQDEQAQLAAVLKSTGEAAGYNADQLNSMAERLSGLSIFSDGDINKAQTRLLSYTNIVGTKFPEALQAAIDMAARLGMPLEQAAEQIGKALDVPSQGLSALSKQGFRFTEDQKKLVESLENTGKVGEAQKIVLDALNSSYGGAAEAARNTFGGALEGLKNQLDSLMTGSDGSLEGATGSVNELTSVLGSNETKAAFNSFTGLITGTINLLVKASAEFLNFSRFVGEFAGKIANGTADPIERADERIGELKESISQLNKEINRPLTAGLRPEDLEQMKAMRSEAEKELKALQGMRDSLARGENMPAATGPAGAAPTGRTPTGGGGKTPKGKDADADFKAYLNNLQQQIQKTNDLTVSEKLLDDIRRGALTVTDKQKAELAALAALVDKQKELAASMNDGRAAAMAEGDAITRANEEYQALVKRLLDGGPAAQLEKQRMEMQALADAFLAGQINADQFNDAATGALGLVGEKVAGTKSMTEELGMTFSSAIEDAALGGGKVQDVFKGLLQDIARVILRMQVIEPMMKQLKDSMSGGGGGGGFGKMLLGAIAGSLGGGMTASFAGTSVGSSGFGTGLAYGNQDFGGYFADGGDPPVGKVSVVGERGPELFIPRTAGRIIPNEALGGAGRGEPPIIINQTQGRVDRMERQDVGGREAWILQQAEERSVARMRAELMQPSSRTSRGMRSTYKMERNF